MALVLRIALLFALQNMPVLQATKFLQFEINSPTPNFSSSDILICPEKKYCVIIQIKIQPEGNTW